MVGAGADARPEPGQARSDAMSLGIRLQRREELGEIATEHSCGAYLLRV